MIKPLTSLVDAGRIGEASQRGQPYRVTRGVIGGTGPCVVRVEVTGPHMARSKEGDAW
jgi:hypothetical protein